MIIVYSIDKLSYTHRIPLGVLKHRHTVISLKCAEVSYVQGDSLTKVVLLEDVEGYVGSLFSLPSAMSNQAS